MCQYGYVAFREIAFFLWYELSAIWDSLGLGRVRICQFIYGLAYIHENVLNSHLNDLTSNLDYVPEIFKRSSESSDAKGKKVFEM